MTPPVASYRLSHSANGLTVSSFHILSGPAALAFLDRSSTRARWQELIDSSRIATPFQAPEFVLTWYRRYSAQWQPLVLYGGSEYEISFLMTLASNSTLVMAAGMWQAEYQVWLGKLPHGTNIETLLDVVAKAVPGAVIRLRFVPEPEALHLTPRTPWWGNAAIFMHTRPLRILDPEEVAASLKKKGNKSKLNRLRRLGTLQFARVQDPIAMAAVLDELRPLYDFRQGAVNGAIPFAEDPQKMGFLSELFNAMNERIHLTTLRLDGRLIAAHLGFQSGNCVHLAIFCHAPDLADHSPGKMHLLFLLEALTVEGVHLLDLTPGGDPWKERFATEHDTVAEILYRPNVLSHARDTLVKNFSRRLKEYAPRVHKTIKQILFRLPYLDLSTRNILKGSVTRLWRTTTLKLYVLHTVPSDASERKFQRNSLDDLLQFSADTPWQNLTGFLRTALERIEEGQVVYSLADSTRLLATGWLNPSATRSVFSEVSCTVQFPEGSAVVYDAYVTPSARGAGLQRACLIERITDAFNEHGAQQVYVCVKEDNTASKRSIESLGFSHAGSITWRRTPFDSRHEIALPDNIKLLD